MSSTDSMLNSIGTGLEFGALVLVTAEAFLFVERREGSRPAPGIRLMNWFGSVASGINYRTPLQRLSFVGAVWLGLGASVMLVAAIAGSRQMLYMGYFFGAFPAQILATTVAAHPRLVERLMRATFKMLERHLRTLLLFFSGIFGIGVLLQFIAVTF